MRPPPIPLPQRPTLPGPRRPSNWLTLDEKRMLDPHNRKRASRGLGRLRVHPALTKAAGD